MSFLSDLFSDVGHALTDVWNTTTQIPGSLPSVLQAIYNGVNGDASWNPFSKEASVWDQGVLGSKLSEDQGLRTAGRLVGTAIGSYFTGGLASSYLGSSMAGGAANGAAWAGAHAAGTGQNVEKAMLKGGLGGGLASYAPDVAGYAGVTDPVAGNAINGAARGGLGALVSGGNVGLGALSGGIQGGIRGYGIDQTGHQPTSDSQQTYNDITQTSSIPDSGRTSTASILGSSGNGEGGMSYAPAYTSTGTYNAPEMQAPAQESSWASPDLGAFMGKILPQSKEGWGDMAQGLMGLYAANKQRRMARDLRNQIGGNRSAYGTQLQRELQRRDAAAGRRSNYGGRAVELQSSLAKLDSQNAPAMAQLQQAELGGLMNMFQTGLRYGGKSGWFGDRNNPNVPQQPGYSLNNPSMESYKNPMPMDQTSFDPYRRFRIDGGGA